MSFWITIVKRPRNKAQRANYQSEGFIDLPELNVMVGEHGGRLMFWCPACDESHGVNVSASRKPCWDWDGDLEAPTISPSIRVQSVGI